MATTPLLPGSLTSPVTLAIPADGELPGLGLRLTGAASLPLFGKVDPFAKDGRIRNSFTGIPDVPLERFELDVHGRQGVATAAPQGRVPRVTAVGYRQARRPQRRGREPAPRR